MEMGLNLNLVAQQLRGWESYLHPLASDLSHAKLPPYGTVVGIRENICNMHTAMAFGK